MLKTLPHKLTKFCVAHAVMLAILLLPQAARATDSYRWLHVTIDTPWAIFIFLLPMVLLPVVLMAYLYWRFAWRAGADNKTKGRPRPATTQDKG